MEMTHSKDDKVVPPGQPIYCVDCDEERGFVEPDGVIVVTITAHCANRISYSTMCRGSTRTQRMPFTTTPITIRKIKICRLL